MTDERRRYFRINETLGIAYHITEGDHEFEPKNADTDILAQVSRQDKKIEKLLLEVGDSHPKIAELITVFNQKLERIVNQLVIESNLVGRIAHRIKEANISACGVAFENNESVPEGARLKMELTLYPSDKKLIVNGMVVGCDELSDDAWYWRIDFFGMNEDTQETLIQHVVKSQGLQLKRSRGN